MVPKNFFKVGRMNNSKYRSANLILQSILEAIIKSEDTDSNHFKKGILKSHLIQQVHLKSTTADKYLTKMQQAGYINAQQDSWGERDIIVYDITEKGRERYKWFVQINTELEIE